MESTDRSLTLIDEVQKLISGSDPQQHQLFDLVQYQTELSAFLPEVIVDAHVHLWTPECLAEPICPERYQTTMLEMINGFTGDAFDYTYQKLLPDKVVHGVGFGLVAYEADAKRVNHLVATETAGIGARLLVPPIVASANDLREQLDQGEFAGFKPYPERVRYKRLNDVEVNDVVTEAQWQVANERKLAILLHLPCVRMLADSCNVLALEQRLEEFPQAKLVLAHMGATACIDGLAQSLERLQGFSNLFFDTAMVGTVEIFELVFEMFGAERVLFGTDLPFALLRAQRTCHQGQTKYLTQEQLHFGHYDGNRRTYLLYETLLAIKAAAGRSNLTQREVHAIFKENAQRVYGIDTIAVVSS